MIFFWFYILIFFFKKANYKHQNESLLKRRFIRKGKGNNGISHPAVSAAAGIVPVTGR